MSALQRVLFVAAEAAPLVKVGGLADVVGALPKALRKLGLEVQLWLPYYERIHKERMAGHTLDPIRVPWSGRQETVNLMQSTLPGSDVPLILFDHPLLNAGEVYVTKASSINAPGERERFGFFSAAVNAALVAKLWEPQLLHLHDWHVSLVALLRQTKRNRIIPTLLTIHNLALQGDGDVALLTNLGLDPNASPHLAEDVKDGRLNLLRQGIAHSHRLNTVSPSYAKEILTPEYGEGLDAVLALRQNDLSGILNGIDVEAFNPATDPAIPARFSASDLSGKTANKLALQKRCGLRVEPERFLLGSVGRLSDQKGVELILEIVPELVKRDAQLVVLGSGNETYERALQEAAKRNPGHLFVELGFDAAFAQAIYAGCDGFLMPSRFEPCGLGQMIAMRYGTVPIVRLTGGLKDTVIDLTSHPTTGTGFAFEPYRANELLATVDRAAGLFANQRKQWYAVVERIMSVDFSWERSSKAYVTLYEETIRAASGKR